MFQSVFLQGYWERDIKKKKGDERRRNQNGG